MLSIFLNESISTMARSALMRVPIAIYLSRVYLLSRRFSRSSRRFSRKAPTFLEKSPTFFRTTPTFFLYIPALAASHSSLSTTGRPHRRTIYRQPRARARRLLRKPKLCFPPLLQNPPFKPCLQNIKSHTLSTEKVNKKADFTLLIHFFAVKPEKRRNFISQTLGFYLTLG